MSAPFDPPPTIVKGELEPLITPAGEQLARNFSRVLIGLIVGLLVLVLLVGLFTGGRYVQSPLAEWWGGLLNGLNLVFNLGATGLIVLGLLTGSRARLGWGLALLFAANLVLELLLRLARGAYSEGYADMGYEVRVILGGALGVTLAYGAAGLMVAGVFSNNWRLAGLGAVGVVLASIAASVGTSVFLF